MRHMPILLAALLVAAPLAAQRDEPPDSLPPTNQNLFRQLDLAPPSTVRGPGGAPGPEYWQNEADYRIQASLDTTRHRVTGTETIHYVNNSPDDLPFLWLQLDQNLFRPESRGDLVNAGSRWRGSFAGGGDDLSRVEVVMNGRRLPPEYLVDGTRMRVDLPEPLAARGGALDLDIDWSFVVPEYGADRMGRFHGRDGWVYEVAQWYPRMFVYDDVHGWNPLPYVGQGEFYLEYGTFDVQITAPRGLTVVATGSLQNPDETLSATERSRLERARTSAETVSIVGPDEVGSDLTRPQGQGPVTWRFHADSVRDFSWAASKAFIWDAASWEDVLLMAAYPREGLGTADDPGWEQAVRYQRHTISEYSGRWYRYPYPVAINVAGVVGGMEYPMIVFCGVDSRGGGLFSVTDHELGHSWFPMIVGSDERRWAWMDEGFNTFINHYSKIDFWGDSIRKTLPTRPERIVQRQLSSIGDQPIMTHPDDLRREGLGFAAYRKPAYGLVMLREAVLGPERFDAAFRTYIKRWAYKHPKPADFFRTMEDVSGADLDWFWRGWFMGTGTLDQAVDSVWADSAGSHVALSNRGELVMPVDLEVTLPGGGSRRIRLPVQIWARSDYHTLNVPDPITGVRIDPDHILPDTDLTNNAWGGARATTDESEKGHPARRTKVPGRPSS